MRGRGYGPDNLPVVVVVQLRRVTERSLWPLRSPGRVRRAEGPATRCSGPTTTVAPMALPENFRYKVKPLETAEYRDAATLQGELNRQATLGWEFVGTVTLDVDNGAGPREQLVYRRSDRQ